MSTIKVETIRRNCDDGLAVSILEDRGLISEAEALDLYRRCRAKNDEWAARIYGWRVGAEAKCSRCGEWIRLAWKGDDGAMVWDHPDHEHHTVCNWYEGMDDTDKVAVPPLLPGEL